MTFLRGLWQGWREFWALSWWGKGPMLATVAGALLITITTASGSSPPGGVGSGTAPGSAPLRDITTQLDSRQIAYGRLLQQARQDVASDPNLNCDPDYQQLVIDQIPATGAEKALIQLAMGDACIEAGEWPGGSYSAYHR